MVVRKTIIKISMNEFFAFIYFFFFYLFQNAVLWPTAPTLLSEFSERLLKILVA